jgi:hypothetical protein
VTDDHSREQEPRSATRAVFGDFWRRATQLALPSAQPERAAGVQQIRHISFALDRAITVMRRYVTDLEANAGGVGRSALGAGAIEGCLTSLERAADALGPEASSGDPPPFHRGALAERIDSYATAMIYGRDLLHTHFATAPDGGREARSDWAPVIASVPVSRALLAGLADQARAIAVQIAALPLDPTATVDAAAGWRRLRAAGHHLRAADGAVQAAQWQAPAGDEYRRLLDAIPINALPPPQLPSATETISSLCAGMISTAQRAGRAQQDLAARATWAPELTADSMRHIAAHCVVTSLNAEIVFHVLAERARQIGSHALIPDLLAVADRAVEGRHAWLAVARNWDQMVTDTRGYLSRPSLEAAALAQWTGRLAYVGQDWTPARRPSADVRDPAALAADPAAFTGVITAMHYALATLSRFATTGLDTVLAATTAGRLYVTTRSLPDKYDVPRRFADAPHDRVTRAIWVYSRAAAACRDTLQSAGRVADAVGAPSRVLTAVEQALAHAEGLVPRGRVEQSLLDLGVTDTRMLRRGAALDGIAQRLLADARGDRAAERQPGLGELISMLSTGSSPAALLAATGDTEARGPVYDTLAGQYVPRLADDLAAGPAPDEDGSPARHQTRHEARLEDFAELRGWGLTVDQAATRLGVEERSAWRYQAEVEPLSWELVLFGGLSERLAEPGGGPGYRAGCCLRGRGGARRARGSYLSAGARSSRVVRRSCGDPGARGVGEGRRSGLWCRFSPGLGGRRRPGLAARCRPGLGPGVALAGSGPVAGGLPLGQLATRSAPGLAGPGM